MIYGREDNRAYWLARLGVSLMDVMTDDAWMDVRLVFIAMASLEERE